jgi:hypothetical protein
MESHRGKLIGNGSEEPAAYRVVGEFFWCPPITMTVQ